MAKQRMINTKFWSDPWVMTKLNSLDRLLFLYLISNELTNISGIYEISEHRIAFDTGIERDTLVKAMLPRLEPKVYYKDNWIILINFTKHQNLKSQDVILGIQREFHAAPIAVQQEAMGRGWGEGLGMMPDTKPNLTKPNLSEDKKFTIEGEEKEGRRTYAEIVGYASNRVKPIRVRGEEIIGHKFTNQRAQEKHIAVCLQSGYSEEEIISKFEELITDEFWGSKGVDFGTVSSQISKAKKKPQPIKSYGKQRI